MGQEEWIYERTLGSKEKPFYWKIDKEGNIFISRKFKNKQQYVIRKISTNELNELDNYLRDGSWKALANNVAKLRLGTEKAGIGKFLYEELGMSVTDAQLSSHLGAIFSKSGAWIFNGKQKNMEFKSNADDWAKVVREYYFRKISSF